MSQPMLAVIAHLRASMEAFLDALEAEVSARWTKPLPPRADPPPTPAQNLPYPPPPRARKVAASVPPPPLPKPLIPGRNTPVLSDETRKASMDVAVAALERMRDLGINPAQWQQGLIGHLANERVAYDAQLITDALQAVQR